MRTRGPHICPRCGERVTAFAAGCAICGAELDIHRGQGPPRLTDRLRSITVRLPRRPRRASLVRRP